eukprot:scaffold18768_cov12-Tisochrysis_lutea.AAC.1
MGVDCREGSLQEALALATRMVGVDGRVLKGRKQSIPEGFRGQRGDVTQHHGHGWMEVWTAGFKNQGREFSVAGKVVLDAGSGGADGIFSRGKCIESYDLSCHNMFSMVAGC